MDWEALLKYPAVLATAFAVTYLCTPLFIRIAPALGLMDRPGGRRLHARPTPRGGGIAVFLGFHAGCAVMFLLPWARFEGQVDVAWWLRFLVVSTILLVVGLADDRWGLRPAAKLACQCGVALLAYAWGMRMRTLIGVPLPPVADVALTVLWIVGIINAFNLIDGLDGLAAGLGVIGCAGLTCAFLLRRLPGDALTMLAMIGACLAFLRFNFSPARVFLGDTGSMFIGLTIASSALFTSSKGAAATSILLPLFAAGVPLFDTGLAVWRRTARAALRRGDGGGDLRTVAEPDTDHLHHRLARLGWSHRRVAIALYLLSGSLVGVGVLLTVFRSQTLGISLGAFVLGAYVVVRHLARVELWDTGEAILDGLKRPQTRTLSVVLYPLFDISVMAAGLLLVLLVTRQGWQLGSLKKTWVDAAGVWIGIPFILLVAAGTYRRVWGRARPSEFVVVALAAVAGILLAGGVTALVGRMPSAGVGAMIMAYAGIVVPAVVGGRTVGQIAQDGMGWMRKRRAGGRRIVLYGAGSRAILLLRGSTSDASPDFADAGILGFLDPDSNLHGRLVYGYEVLGDIEALAGDRLRDVQEIVVVCDITPAQRAHLLAAARARGIAVSEWRTVRVPVLPPS